ncbi:fungal-specific transcription factor domain-containing protein [Xylariales sp. PMI_506]|nr:fungal-specific transcription factor domain-containing protein [Xylariales sp. PMI_506]
MDYFGRIPDPTAEGSASQVDSPGTRIRACTQCHRQKQKCNKERPCSNCTRRGIPHLCMWPVSQKRPLSRSRSSDTAADEAPWLQRRRIEAAPQPEASLSPLDSSTSHEPRGTLLKARGAPSYHGKSYFGYLSAAYMMETSTPELPRGVDIGRSRRTQIDTSQPYRSERGPYALMWELLGSLPRRKVVVDHLVNRFMKELNPTFDAVHEDTFLTHYEKFWERTAGDDDLDTLDIRWLALLFSILAYGELLDCPQPCSVEVQREHEDSSLHFYWTARKAIVIAPSFEGESPDLIRAGILLTKYLNHAYRISECWLTVGVAVRMAQAQGMHIDGDELKLPRKVVETRRRLWSQLYYLDRATALALGRPPSINEQHCTSKEPRNIWVDNLSSEAADSAQPNAPGDPTPSIFLMYQHQLAAIIAQIQDVCFGAAAAGPRTSNEFTSYEEVLRHDEKLLAWKDGLPPYFAMDRPDTTLDEEYPYLHWHRTYLHMAYHFTRITLHRAYLLRASFTDHFAYSRNACISSACADLKIKLGFRNPTMADRIKANVAAFRLFNSALILGVVVVRDPHGEHTEAILNDLQVYCNKINTDTWSNEFGLAEVRVVELCIARATRMRSSGPASLRSEIHVGQMTPRGGSSDQVDQQHEGLDQPDELPDGFLGDTFPTTTEVLPDVWSSYYFPQPTNYQVWKGLVDQLAVRR